MKLGRFFSLCVLLMFLLSSVTLLFQNSSTQTSREISNSELNNVYPDLANQATNVVIGEVKNVESRWEAEGVIYSYIRISVEKYLKGNFSSDEIVVKQKGGEVGNICLRVSTEPRFEKNERVEVFLKSFEKADEFVVVGGRQGKISLGSSASSGYSYDGIHWASADLPVEYYVNEDGTPDVSGTNEFLSVQASFQTWENDSGSYIDYTYMGTTSRSGSSNDGFNVVSWQSIDGSGGTLAETSYWYESSTKLLFEFDIVFDEDETWSVSSELGKYDVRNIGTHEVGHTLVLNDLYDLADAEETMYGYSSTGETKKRNLYTGDIAGVRSIYGSSTITYTIDTNPTGLQIEVDGANYTTPYSFSWVAGSEHFVAALSPQNKELGARYVFKEWSDGGAQAHSVIVGVNDATILAHYNHQFQLSFIFKTDDNAREIYPNQIEIFGGVPNNTLITLRSYSNVWLDDVEWTIKEIVWQGNDVVPSVNPTAQPSANLEWTVRCRVYPTLFDKSFKDSNGLWLPTNPSSFRLEFPNETISSQMNQSGLYSVYYIQNGTTAWHSVIWQKTEVVPVGAVFDAADGDPIVNCLIYGFTIRVTDLFNLPVLGASVSVTLPYNTTMYASTGIDGYAVFRMIPQGKFTATISYLGQTVTLDGDVATAAAYQTRAQITFSMLVISSLLVPAILTCLVIIFVKRRSRSSKNLKHFL
jgi:hypothetical protein